MPDDPTRGTDYTDCVVVFIDVLGFRELVTRSVTEPPLLGVLTRALRTMAEVRGGIKESRYQDTEGRSIKRTWAIQTRVFSDTVVIFAPIEAGVIPQCLFMARFIHDRMLELGMCVRGSVTQGEMYWDTCWGHAPDEHPPVVERGQTPGLHLTLGPGLIDAYDLEQEEADVPRIVISDSIREYTTHQEVRCLPFGPYTPAQRPLSDFFRLDRDGWHFLDLLHPDVLRNDTERIEQTPGPGNTSPLLGTGMAAHMRQ